MDLYKTRSIIDSIGNTDTPKHNLSHQVDRLNSSRDSLSDTSFNVYLWAHEQRNFMIIIHLVTGLVSLHVQSYLEGIWCPAPQNMINTIDRVLHCLSPTTVSITVINHSDYALKKMLPIWLVTGGENTCTKNNFII